MRVGVRVRSVVYLWSIYVMERKFDKECLAVSQIVAKITCLPNGDDDYAQAYPSG